MSVPRSQIHPFGLVGLLLGLLVCSSAVATLPSHEQVLIDALTGEDDVQRVEAAQTLAERKRADRLNPHTEARIREIYFSHSRFEARMAAAFYFGESIKGSNSDEDWAWLLHEFEEQEDPAIRMVLAHDLGEIAGVDPDSDGFNARRVRLRELEYKQACRRLLQRSSH